jgi:hypothetical protein
MVALSAGWENKGTEATVGQRYQDPYGAVTPDVDGFGDNLADRMLGPDPTVAPKQIFNPPLQ